MNAAIASPDTVAGLLAQRAAATPQAIAFRQEAGGRQWRALTWEDFSQQVTRLRQALHTAGLHKGDRLALIAPVSLRWELLHHAALGMGVVVVGLDGHDLPERIATMVEQADVTAIACASPQAVARIRPDRLAACRLRLGLDAPKPASAFGPDWSSWEEFEALAARPGAAPPRAAGGDLATIIFTSGTTGAPKGIAYSHAQVCLAVSAICDAFAFAGTESRLLCWLPLSNLFQRMVNLAALRQGAATYLLDDPRRVMDVVGDVSPDVFVSVPRFFEKLHAGLLESIARQPWLQRTLVHWAWQTGRRARALERAHHPLPWPLALADRLADRLVRRRVRAVLGTRLQCLVSGSAPTPLHLLEEFHALGWLVLEAYGLSENILPMAMNRIGDFRFGTVGRPMPGNDIRIDEDGTIKVRGPGLFSGYLDEKSPPAFDGQGFYRTGDLGAFDPDGYLRLTGRSGDLIKTSTGRRVAPAGVEATLRSVPGIDQALLVGAGRKCLVALCTCTIDLSDATSRSALSHRLRVQLAQLGEHDRPLAIGLMAQPFSIEQGELTPNLKLRRDAIALRHADLLEELFKAVDARTSPRPDVLVI